MDSEMKRVVATSGAGAVIMHMRGAPATMQDDPKYEDVVAEVRTFLIRQMAAAMSEGISRDAIIIDPGFGFGKTPEQNAELLRGLGELRGLGRPVLAGVSRKSFVPKGPGDWEPRRKGAALAAVAVARIQGADIVRAHAVRETLPFLRALDGLMGPPEDPENI